MYVYMYNIQVFRVRLGLFRVCLGFFRVCLGFLYIHVYGVVFFGYPVSSTLKLSAFPELEWIAALEVHHLKMQASPTF